MTISSDLKNFIDKGSVLLNGTGTVDRMGNSDIYRLKFDESESFTADRGMAPTRAKSSHMLKAL